MKAKSVARCQACGATMPRWMGRCSECQQWGTVVEELAARPAEGSPPAEIISLVEYAARRTDRLPTGIEEVDRVLGGGLVAGSVVLLGGEPGIGKSTLALQVAARLAEVRDVVYVCGEEAASQVRDRALRVGGLPGRLRATQEVAVPRIDAVAEPGSVLVVDSVQTLEMPDIASAPGSVAQVRESGAHLARLARDRGVTVVLVGHVTKEGTIAGPRVLEHLVDVVLTFEGDQQLGLRMLRAQKNRFGSTQEVGVFEMAEAGLVGIRDASRYLLQDRCPGTAGSVLAASVDGRRPFVLEVQALVASKSVSVPRRAALGVDAARLPLLVAVLERRLGVDLADQDVYVSAVGGIRAAEPACDLPVVLALLSAASDARLADDLVAFGEVGLGGEIRQVVSPERRLAEAAAVGCRVAAVPHGYAGPDAGLTLRRVRRLHDVLDLVGPLNTKLR